MRRAPGPDGSVCGVAERPRASSDLAGRVALRPPEAARALGVSERTLRGLLPELPHVRRGAVVLIPVDALRRWLEEQAHAGRARADRIAAEIEGSASSRR